MGDRVDGTGADRLTDVRGNYCFGRLRKSHSKPLTPRLRLGGSTQRGKSDGKRTLKFDKKQKLRRKSINLLERGGGRKNVLRKDPGEKILVEGKSVKKAVRKKWTEQPTLREFDRRRKGKSIRVCAKTTQ